MTTRYLIDQAAKNLSVVAILIFFQRITDREIRSSKDSLLRLVISPSDESLERSSNN